MRLGWYINRLRSMEPAEVIHRLGAYVLLAVALWHMIDVRRRLPGTTHARRALVLFHLMLLQAAIGVLTLVMQVPMHAALLHQGFALVVLGFAAAHWRATEGSYPMETEVAVGR